MRRRNGGRPSGRREPTEPLTGRCDHCDWETVQSSHSAVVEAYQNHLREHHHDAWVRG